MTRVKNLGTKRKSEIEEDIRERAIRTIAAMILAETSSRSKITIKKISEVAKNYGLELESLMPEIEERFSRVGLKLKRVRTSDTTGDPSKIELFVVVDPDLDVGGGRLDRVSSAILAAIYIKFGRREVYIRDVVKLIGDIIGTPDRASDVVYKSIRILENEGLVIIDSEKGSLKLSPKALALLPDKKDLEALLIGLLTEKRINK